MKILWLICSSVVLFLTICSCNPSGRSYYRICATEHWNLYEVDSIRILCVPKTQSPPFIININDTAKLNDLKEFQ